MRTWNNANEGSSRPNMDQQSLAANVGSLANCPSTLSRPNVFGRSNILFYVYIPPAGGGVHNMLRVRVCAAHLGGFLGPKFSKQATVPFSADFP